MLDECEPNAARIGSDALIAILERLARRSIAGAACEPRLDGRAPAVPEGLRVCAFGDIHGRLDLLRALEQRVMAEPTAAERTLFVYLGDFVDRGPDSRGVLEHLTAPAPRQVDRVFLCGNHDYWFRSFLETGQCDQDWLMNGGMLTLASYGITLDRLSSLANPPGGGQSTFRTLVPATHQRFLFRLEAIHVLGDYAFCHAGIRPGRSIEEQVEADLMWIREPFLSHRGEFGKIVVHGHTPVAEPEIRRNRIGIDTGAVWTGRLTGLVLEGSDRRFLTAEG
jgi:serine/threonine protein phosphatase 1